MSVAVKILISPLSYRRPMIRALPPALPCQSQRSHGAIIYLTPATRCSGVSDIRRLSHTQPHVAIWLQASGLALSVMQLRVLQHPSIHGRLSH